MNSIKQVLCWMAVVAVAAAGYAATPSLINFQGRLTTQNSPVADGNYTISFAIYDAPTGGTVMWHESHSGVAVAQGLFSVILGSIVPLTDTVFNSPNRFLEISIGNEIITPRSQLTSVGYAQRVATLDGSTAGTITGDLVITQPGGTGKIVLGFGDNQPGSSVTGMGKSIATISLYEPIDSRVTPGMTGERKSMEMSGGQIVVFGSTVQDTNLIVSPGGDIVGVGQITMGMNSSSGSKTSVLGFENTASGDSSTIGGGSANVTTGTISVIAGGHANTASSEGGTIGGGAHNNISGPYATIPGGLENSASGSYATAAGGNRNEANGDWSFAAGRRAQALTHGSFVWADHEDADFASTGEDQFIVRARGGVGIGTNSPIGALDVAGPSGDSSVNLPMSSISAPEILDEPGIAATISPDIINLTQHASVPQLLTQVTIETPAAGYVVVHGSVTLEVYGTSRRNQAYLQVAETPSQTLSPWARLAGPGENDSPNEAHYFDLNVDQIYFVSAGSHTFLLEGLAHPLNGSDAVTAVNRPQIIANFYTTSYGAVGGFVGSQLSSQFTNPTPVTWPNAADSLSALATDQYYKVDLRELELATVRAQSQAAALEKQLLEAKLRQQGTNIQR